MPIDAREAMVQGRWVALAALGVWLNLWLTGPLRLALLAAVVVGAWRAGAVVAQSRRALDTAARALALESAKRQHALDTAESQLATAQEALLCSQKMAALGRLTVGIAHDFNNQLTVISSNVELLQRHLGSADARVTRHTEAAMHGVQRAAALISRLVSLSHTKPPEPEAVDVGRLLDDVGTLLRRSLGNHVGLDLRLPEHHWFVWADLGQMEHALLSLAVSACDQAGDGGTLTLAAETIRFETAHPGTLPGEYVQISVRTAAADRPIDAGGFAMALALARAAGGTVLSSGGTSCRWLLPRYLPPAPAMVRTRTAGCPTILVVENDQPVRAACVEVLRDLGYAVMDAPDAMEAFRLIADGGGADLLVTDMALPGGVSGRALADAARQLDPALQVVFITGYPSDDLPLGAGAALLQKPFNPEQLVGMVRQALAAGQPAAGLLSSAE